MCLGTDIAVIAIACGSALLVSVVSLKEQAHISFTQVGLGVDPVLASPWGYHIMKTEPVSDNDIMLLLRKKYLQKESRRLNDEIKKSARIEQVKITR